jgi:hypothetical protein
MTNTSLNQNISLNQEVSEQKKPFTPPQIVELGSAEDLIQGGNAGTAEDGSSASHYLTT